MLISLISRPSAALFLSFGLWGTTVFSGLISQSARAETSGVVGFYDISVPAGNSAWVCGLVGVDLFTGNSTTVTADTDGKALVRFVAGGGPKGGFFRPCWEPRGGWIGGLPIHILSNTADTLKLDITPDSVGLTSGGAFIIRKHATLKGLLPDGNGFTPGVDTICLFGSDGLQTLYYFSNVTNTWIDILNNDASNVVVRPAQGFVIHLSPPQTITFGRGEICHVKTSPTQIRIHANVPNIAGALNPVGGTTTRLDEVVVSGSMQAYNDSVVTLSPGPLMQTGTFLAAGPAFIDSSNGANANGNTLQAGSGVVINVNTAKNVIVPAVSVAP